MSRAAVVAPNTLVARELRERLAERSDLFAEVRLLSADEDEIGQLAESGGAAAFVARLDADAFDDVDVAFFCGAIDGDRSWIESLPESVRAVVLSYGGGLGDGVPALAGLGGGVPATGPLLVPHPAAVGAALLLAPLAPLGLRAAQAVAILPVSRHGEEGLEALFEQTRALLAFQSPAKKGPLKSQMAFNVSLAAADAVAVARQVKDCLGVELPVSLQLVDGGIFHGVGLSLRVELGEEVTLREVRRALAGDRRLEIARQPSAVSPVALAGTERLEIGEIRAADEAGCFWLWAAYDNLVFAGALAALELSETLVGGTTPPS